MRCITAKRNFIGRRHLDKITAERLAWRIYGQAADKDTVNATATALRNFGEYLRQEHQMRNICNVTREVAAKYMQHLRESDYATSTQANYVSRINQVYRHFGREDITQVFGNPRDYGICRDRSDQTDPRIQKANPEQAINDFKSHMEQKGGFRAEAVRIVTSLQRDLGLRLEESLKLKVTDKTIETAKRTGEIRIEKTKGNRPRLVPVSEKALNALKKARDWQKEYNASANIPTSMSYQQMAKLVKNQYTSFKQHARLDRFSPHGNRHAYAQERFVQLTGESCPLASGRFGEDNVRAIAESRGVSMDEAREIDSQARAEIAEELGHGRDEITHTYLGR